MRIHTETWDNATLLHSAAAKLSYKHGLIQDTKKMKNVKKEDPYFSHSGGQSSEIYKRKVIKHVLFKPINVCNLFCRF